MRELISYEDYLRKTNRKDCMTSWKWWKMEVYRMSETDAIRSMINEYKSNKESSYKKIMK